VGKVRVFAATTIPGQNHNPRPGVWRVVKSENSHLKRQIDAMIYAKEARKVDIIVGTQEYATYFQLTAQLSRGRKLIGAGEAAAIVLAKMHNGIVASNNLSDIGSCVQQWGLRHVTTGDILVHAYNKGLITEAEGNFLGPQCFQNEEDWVPSVFQSSLETNSRMFFSDIHKDSRRFSSIR